MPTASKTHDVVAIQNTKKKCSLVNQPPAKKIANQTGSTCRLVAGSSKPQSVENGAALFGREAWTYNAAPRPWPRSDTFSGSVRRYRFGF
jgi:hypothetical protein